MLNNIQTVTQHNLRKRNEEEEEETKKKIVEYMSS